MIVEIEISEEEIKELYYNNFGTDKESLMPKGIVTYYTKQIVVVGLSQIKNNSHCVDTFQSPLPDMAPDSH